MAKFNFNERNTYIPVFEEVDFHQIRTDIIHKKGYVPYECWISVKESYGKYEQQITQDNTFIELNSVSPYMDRIVVTDQRDDGRWVWYRDEFETFEKVLDNIADYAEVTTTMYPREYIVKEYLARKLAKLMIQVGIHDV